MASPSAADRIPVVVGVGRFTQRAKEVKDAEDPIGMMAISAGRALEDSGVAGAATRELGAVATVSMALQDMLPRGYGNLYRNPSKSLAQRIGASQVPDEHTYIGTSGGYSSQFLVTEMCERIAKGEFRSALVSGCEDLATYRRAMKAGYTLPGATTGTVVTRDAAGRKTEVDASKAPVLPWGDQIEAAPVEVGFGLPPLSTRHEALHGLANAPNQYAILEQAIRKDLGRGVKEHMAELGKLFEGFARTASEQPEHAWFPTYRDAENLTTVTPANRLVGYPYPKYMNAIIDVDQAAALLLVSVGNRRFPAKW